MHDESPRTDDTDSRLSRRGFVRATAAGGAGLAALGAGGSASAHETGDRTSYTILSGTPNEQTVHVYRSGVAGPTTAVVGGIHGDERAGYRAADRIADWTVDTGSLVVIPRAHPDAIADDVRPWDGDLNRQFPPTGGDCTTELAAAIWREVERHDPDWVFDLHSSRGIYESGDGGVGQALFPTWTSPARSTGEDTVAALNDAFDLNGDMAYKMGNTLDADRDMLMHRVAGVLDRPGFICEATEKAPLEDQVAWHLFAVEDAMARYGQDCTTPAAVTGQSTLPFEGRTLAVDDPWASYGLDGSYDDPVVLAPALSSEGPQPAHTRVRRVSASGFQARVEEWLYQNDVHYAERTGALAVETGAHHLADGHPLEAGTTTVDHQFGGVAFDAAFAAPPVVLTQAQTENGTDPIVTRVRDVTTDGFGVCVQEEDGEEHGGYHYDERVGYVAVVPGVGTLGDVPFEAGTTTVDEAWTGIAFERDYDDPVFLAGVQSFNGWNSVAVRYRDLTGSGVEVMLQEEQSEDAEMGHVDETVGYLIVEG